MVDWWDVLGIVGLSALLCGVGAIYWPAALILGGVMLLGVYLVRELRHVPESPPPAEEESE